MKIFEWKNILCPHGIDSMLIFSEDTEFVRELTAQTAKANFDIGNDSTKQYSHIFFDYQSFFKNAFLSNDEKFLNRLASHGKIVIFENKGNFSLNRFLLKLSIRRALKRKRWSQQVMVKEIISIPSLYRPACIYAVEDKVLQGYIFHNFLLSYNVFKTLGYQLFFMLSKTQMNSIVANFFSSLFVICKI